MIKVTDQVAEEIAHLQASGNAQFSLALRPDVDNRAVDAAKLGATTNIIIQRYGLPVPQVYPQPGQAINPGPPAATADPNPAMAGATQPPQAAVARRRQRGPVAAPADSGGARSSSRVVRRVRAAGDRRCQGLRRRARGPAPVAPAVSRIRVAERGRGAPTGRPAPRPAARRRPRTDPGPRAGAAGRPRGQVTSQTSSQIAA